MFTPLLCSGCSLITVIAIVIVIIVIIIIVIVVVIVIVLSIGIYGSCCYCYYHYFVVRRFLSSGFEWRRIDSETDRLQVEADRRTGKDKQIGT